MSTLATALELKREARALLIHQLELLESGNMCIGSVALGDLVEQNIKRTKYLINEYDLCISDFERALGVR